MNLANTRIVIEVSPTEDGLWRLDMRWHDLFGYHLLESRDYRQLRWEEVEVAITENLQSWQNAQEPPSDLDATQG